MNKHKLSAIFFIQCEHFLKPDTSGFQRLHRSFGAAVAQYVARQQAGAKFRTAMDAASLPYLPIKGTWVGEAYPHPQLRTMGDLDILVHAEDSERIRDVLSPLGFQNIKWAETEWDYRLNNTLFELQAELFHTGELHNRELEAFLNDPWSWAEPTASGEYRLDQSFHFLYLIAHIAKHLRWVGVGYRQFYDLAVLMQRSRESYDWNWIREQAERLDFLRFVEICLALNERWFGVPSPYPDDALNDELFKTITAKILSDGVFGFENKDNYLQSIAAGQTDADGAGKSRWQHLRTALPGPDHLAKIRLAARKAPSAARGLGPACSTGQKQTEPPAGGRILSKGQRRGNRRQDSPLKRTGTVNAVPVLLRFKPFTMHRKLHAQHEQ